MEKQHYEVAIIGGGPAGAVCAIELIRQGFSDVLIIEGGQHSDFLIGESLPAEANILFRELGIYDKFLNEGHEPNYGNCSVWGSNKRGYNDTILSPHGHGWHLDRSRFNRFLINEASSNGCTLSQNTTLTKSVESDDSRYLLQCSSPNGPLEFITDFVVDATGRKSVFARHQGAELVTQQPLVCLLTRFAMTPSIREIPKQTFIEATEHGWWYAARIPDELFLVAFYSTAQTIKHLDVHRIEVWNGLLDQTDHMGTLVEHMERIDSKPMGFHAPSYILNNCVGHRWLAAGDAACAYDPVTSQGVIKAMSSGIWAGRSIAQYLGGNPDALSSYEEHIKNQFEHYLEVRDYFYGIEKRWPNSSFWQIMHELNSHTHPMKEESTPTTF